MKEGLERSSTGGHISKLFFGVLICFRNLSRCKQILAIKFSITTKIVIIFAMKNKLNFSCKSKKCFYDCIRCLNCGIEQNLLWFSYMSNSSTTNIEELENQVSLLSAQEVEELDVSAALRSIGTNNNLINEVNKALSRSLMDQLTADSAVMRLRELKRALIQNQKSLSVIAVRA